MRLKSFFKKVLHGSALVMGMGLLAPGSAMAGDCVSAGSVVLFVPHKEGQVIGSIGGTVVGSECSYDLKVTKGWTIKLQTEGPVKLSLQAVGYTRVDPTQPFVAKADGTIRIWIKRTSERGADFTYKMIMDLRAPGA